MLESYQRWLFHYRKTNGDPLSFWSQSQRLLAVRAFFKWAAKQRHVLHNPASEIELPRAERRLPRPALTAAEAELVLAQPDLDGPTGVRDRVILEVLYSIGIRRFELAALAVTDIDHQRATLLVRLGKGKKDRLIPVGERALTWVGKYLAEVRPQLATGDDDGTLFLTTEGAPFTLDALTRLASQYVKASGVPKQGACHLFRHTMATLMLEGGADIRYIQAMLGHAELSTTQIYTQVSVRALQAVHTATHPAAANTPRQRKDSDSEQKVAVTELLAALDEEADQDENRPAHRITRSCSMSGPAAMAADAAEPVRALNHSTRPGTGARRSLVLLSAALAAILTLVLPLSSASAVVASAAQNGVGASHPETIFAIGASHPVPADQGRSGPAPQPGIVSGSCVAAEDAGAAAEDGTPIYRGVAQGHNAFEDAQRGIASPGDVAGHADVYAHNADDTWTSRLTSWSTEREVAEGFAGKNGVILQTTIEEMQARGVNMLWSPDYFDESELLFEGRIGGLQVTQP